MNYLGITENSIADGLGNRVVLWVAGCDLNCPGCHNPESHDYDGGELFGQSATDKLFDALDHDYIDGLTLSGGHPFAPRNIKQILHLLMLFKERFPLKNVWVYTGYTFEHIVNSELYKTNFESRKLSKIYLEALKYIDVIVDGPFIMSQRDTTLAFRGSTNQRIIDVQESLKTGNTIVLSLDNKTKFRKYYNKPKFKV